MGTPQNNPTGYHDSSVMTHVPTMSGKLMLVHGLIDENVHFRHTARLINTLIQVTCFFVASTIFYLGQQQEVLHP